MEVPPKTLRDILEAAKHERRVVTVDVSSHLGHEEGTVTFTFQEPGTVEIFASYQDAREVARNHRVPLDLASIIALMGRTLIATTPAADDTGRDIIALLAKNHWKAYAHIQRSWVEAFPEVGDWEAKAEELKGGPSEAYLES